MQSFPYSHISLDIKEREKIVGSLFSTFYMWCFNTITTNSSKIEQSIFKNGDCSCSHHLAQHALLPPFHHYVLPFCTCLLCSEMLSTPFPEFSFSASSGTVSWLFQFLIVFYLHPHSRWSQTVPWLYIPCVHTQHLRLYPNFSPQLLTSTPLPTQEYLLTVSHLTQPLISPASQLAFLFIFPDFPIIL